MMSRTNLLLAVIAIICNHFDGTLRQDMHTERSVHIEVDVRDFRGEPLSDVLLSIFDGESVCVDAATDENGRATMEVEVPTGTHRIEIRHSFAQPTSFQSSEAQVTVSRRMTELRREYFVDSTCSITLTPEDDTYHVKIVFEEAVAVSGMIVGRDNAPIGYVVYGPQPLQLGVAEGGRQFWIRGIEKGADVTLLASFRVSGSVTPLKPIHLTRDQTKDDVNLGRVVMPDLEMDVPISVHLSRLDVVLGTSAGVTLIQPDGDLLFSLRAYDSRHDRAGDVMGNPINLPAGEYYLVPGFVLGSPPKEVWALVDALREGRKFDDINIHKIAIAEDGQQVFSFDLAELQKPLRTLISDSPSPCESPELP